MTSQPITFLLYGNHDCVSCAVSEIVASCSKMAKPCAATHFIDCYKCWCAAVSDIRSAKFIAYSLLQLFFEAKLVSAGSYRYVVWDNKCFTTVTRVFNSTWEIKRYSSTVAAVCLTTDEFRLVHRRRHYVDIADRSNPELIRSINNKIDWSSFFARTWTSLPIWCGSLCDYYRRFIVFISTLAI